MDLDYQSIYDTVKIGDKEQLHYNGNSNVPKYMDGKPVTVVGFTKKNVKVDNGREVFTIRYDQIRRIAQEIRKKEREHVEKVMTLKGV